MRKTTLSKLFSSFFVTVLLAGFIAGNGCSSTKPASASFASVTIHNQPAEKIQNVASQVFRENGYAGGPTGPRTLLFQREGSKANSLAYNGVVGTHYGAQTLVRVKAELVDLGGNSHRLQCQTYMVRNAGDSFFEEESRLTNMRSGPYQKLLNQVAERLQ